MDESGLAWIRDTCLRGLDGNWCPGVKAVPRAASSLFPLLEAGAGGSTEDDADAAVDAGGADGASPPVPLPTPTEGEVGQEPVFLDATESLGPSPVQSLLYSLP